MLKKGAYLVLKADYNNNCFLTLKGKSQLSIIISYQNKIKKKGNAYIDLY